MSGAHPTRACAFPPRHSVLYPPICFIVLVGVLVIVLDTVISSTSITIMRTSTASLSTISELLGKLRGATRLYYFSCTLPASALYDAEHDAHGECMHGK